MYDKEKSLITVNVTQVPFLSDVFTDAMLWSWIMWCCETQTNWMMNSCEHEMHEVVLSFSWQFFNAHFLPSSSSWFEFQWKLETPLTITTTTFCVSITATVWAVTAALQHRLLDIWGDGHKCQVLERTERKQVCAVDNLQFTLWTVYAHELGSVYR